jgi:hypothetical protein
MYHGLSSILYGKASGLLQRLWKFSWSKAKYGELAIYSRSEK